jgi:hypothetical protein
MLRISSLRRTVWMRILLTTSDFNPTGRSARYRVCLLPSVAGKPSRGEHGDDRSGGRVDMEETLEFPCRGPPGGRPVWDSMIDRLQ